MALTPGGGRSPSTQPPPAPPPPPPPPPDRQAPRPTGDRRPRVPAQVAAAVIVRRGLLFGGLVIIFDLAARALVQRTFSVDDQALIGTFDDIANYVLFSLLGMIVVRDTRVIYLGVVAGLFAALLDAIVVAAAGVMAPMPGPGSVEEVFISNLVIGTLFAGVSGAVYALVQGWSRGRRPR